MTHNIFFKIADHILSIKVPANFSLKEYIPSFKDFLIEENEIDTAPILYVSICFDKIPEVLGELKVLSNNSPIWGDGFSFEESDSYYITTMKSNLEASKICMNSTKEFKYSSIYLGSSEEDSYSLIGWFIMVAFGQAVIAYKTIMIHASVVERNSVEAYAFLGKSGTGKSTHSQLWLKNFTDFNLLNDDNPAIRIFDNNEVFIYGTPWSGKTACYRNLKVRLRGFIRLQQAKINKFEIKKNTESLIMLLPSCSAIRWNKTIFNNMVDTVESIIEVVPIGMMDCDVSPEAAYISFNGIKLKNTSYE
ncbi:hypothetical protein [Sphingobacterium rhinopitheci]|uniref:hypothetical protein n=1 Tax=Sphingobacterium rhinopitheci TaxID=2781960 RepID=UPI001F5175B2|nr:hypothetical protein [Sphingobacterium rhinopitheci]MCI0920745.1 hypothetical protein [Sphingobacterium rhinopitheci]